MGEFLKQPYTYFLDLVEEAESIGAIVHIIEFSSPEELRERICSVSNKYSKPIGVFLEGHGPNHLSYGCSEEEGISHNSITGELHKWYELGECLHSDARIVINCCSSGTSNGVAELLGISLSKPITAQTSITGLDTIKIVENGDFVFRPTYVKSSDIKYFDSIQREVQPWINILEAAELRPYDLEEDMHPEYDID